MHSRFKSVLNSCSGGLYRYLDSSKHLDNIFHKTQPRNVFAPSGVLVCNVWNVCLRADSARGFTFFFVLLVGAMHKIFRGFFYALWRLYKYVISPLLGGHCRFYPTCSEYAYLLVSYENPLRASMQIFFRLVRCQPFTQGGIQYPVAKISLYHLRPYFANPHTIKRIALWLIPIIPAHFVTCAPTFALYFILIPSFRSS